VADSDVKERALGSSLRKVSTLQQRFEASAAGKAVISGLVSVIVLVVHLAKMINLDIGFFSLVMFVLYLAFVPPDVVERMPAQVKSRLSRNKEPADP
jgi:hypothetical protein